ncbi:SWPV1-247 [Shearwaterpox virus]|uniref:SWPV1-247 n=1 Tax=Shearwaterpox virus TaxID=1974596 RepID=A0A1V0S858_CNPV|nr:SWPV1-247 [Shearwaterpox virus]
MYKTINASQITCSLKDLLPNDFDKEEDVSLEDMERLKDFIEICINKSYSVTNISDITVLCGEANNTNKYCFTTSNSYMQYNNNGTTLSKNVECFFVVCMKKSCKVNVHLRDREIYDNIRESQGFIIDTGLEHVIHAEKESVILALKFEVNASIFYAHNVVLFTEKNLFSQFYGPNFILYDIIDHDQRNIRLLVTKDSIYNLTTIDRYDIIELKHLFYNCNTPIPTITLSQYEFTTLDMEAVKSVDINTVLSKVSARIETYYHGRLFVKVLYGTVII